MITVTRDTPGFSVAHPSGLRIHQGIREPDVRAVPGVTTRDHRNGYVWYYLPNAEIAGRVIWMGLCFFKHELEFIHLGVADKPEQSGFAHWSQEREQARADAVAQWLMDVGYPVGTYSWGVVHAGVDPRNGDGGGAVRFIRA